MKNVKSIPSPLRINVDSALTKRQEDDLLDAADQLVEVGGQSRDRHRNRKKEKKPKRKGYRPYRNRAIIYTFVGTGIRRSAITRLNVEDVDFERGKIRVIEKGGVTGERNITREALGAIRDYLEMEREEEACHFDSPALFLPAHQTKSNSPGRLSPRAINDIWNHVRDEAGIPKEKTPHKERHAVGKRIMKNTGNIRAVQQQLGHRNIMYSGHYTNMTDEEMKEALNDRR